MNRLVVSCFLLVGCNPIGFVVNVPAPVPLAPGQQDQAKVSADVAGTSHGVQAREWERLQQAARVESKEREAWDAGKPIAVRDTPEGLVGVLVRIDNTADRVDDAMAYFEYQTATVVCQREPMRPHRIRWGRKKSGWKHWRASPGYQRKHYWRRGGRTHTAKEPIQEYRGVFWGYQSAPQQSSADATGTHPTKPTTCKTVTQSWSIGIPHPPSYQFQVGDHIQAIGRPVRTDAGLRLTDASIKFVARGQTVLYAALPNQMPL